MSPSHQNLQMQQQQVAYDQSYYSQPGQPNQSSNYANNPGYFNQGNRVNGIPHGQPPPDVDHHVGVPPVRALHRRVLVLQLLGPPVVLR